MISCTDSSSDNISPAPVVMKLYGISPIKIDNENNLTPTPTCGLAMFKNQFGVKGNNLANSKK